MSTPAEIRAQAALFVMQVADEGRSLDALLENRSDAPQERGLLRSLSYGSVRWYWRLLAVLKKLCSQSPEDLQPEVRALAVVGLYQLLHTDIAAHAAVAETVEAARVLKLHRATGLLNAILRRCQRESDSLSTEVDHQLSARYAHPQWLVTALQKDWPTKAEQILEANNQHPPFWLRVNTRHHQRDDYRALLTAQGISSTISEYAPEAVLLEQAVEVFSLPGFKEGWVSVQDAAAQLAAHLLAVEPNQRVLDACAAPGGKTCHILELQPQLKEVVAIDVSGERMKRVRGNLKRLELEASLIVGSAADPAAWWDGVPFERILLDVPCSATGVIRRHPDIKLLRRAEDITHLSMRQADMLNQLWPLLALGGRLVYASCSSLRAENAQVISAFLESHEDAHEVTSEATARFGNVISSMSEPSLPGEQQVGWAIPAGTEGMDGFYYACLQKRS